MAKSEQLNQLFEDLQGAYGYQNLLFFDLSLATVFAHHDVTLLPGELKALQSVVDSHEYRVFTPMKKIL